MFPYCDKKVSETIQLFKIFITFARRYHSAHAELRLFLAFHGEDLLRRGLGRDGIMTYKAFT